MAILNDNIDIAEQVTAFRIGPLSEEEYQLLPQRTRAGIESVMRGEVNENDTESQIVPPSIRSQITTVQDEVCAFVKRVALSEGIKLSEIESALLLDNIRFDDDEKSLGLERIRMEVIDRLMFGIRLATEESLINHAKHGNRDPRSSVDGRYWFNRDDGHFVIESWDAGNGFSVGNVADPTVEENLELPNGRGLLLMNAYMDEVEFGNKGPEGKFGTSLTMKKRIARLHQHKEEDSDDNALVEHVRKALKSIQKADSDHAKNEKLHERRLAHEQDMTRLRSTWKWPLIKWLSRGVDLQ